MPITSATLGSSYVPWAPTGTTEAKIHTPMVIERERRTDMPEARNLLLLDESVGDIEALLGLSFPRDSQAGG